MSDAIPNVVSYRNHMSSVGAFIDHHMDYTYRLFPEWSESERESVRKWLSSFAGSLLRGISMDMAKGSERGIEQALALIQDPQYYETKKRRLKQERQRSAERTQQEKRERAEKELLPPDLQELARKRIRLERDADMYSRLAGQCQAELEMLPLGKNVVMVKGPVQ